MADKLKIVRRGYTIVPNDIVREEGLTLESFGLLVKMLALPEEWNFSIGGLAAICHCGRDKIRTALNQIEDAGYLLRAQERGPDGKFLNTFILYDTNCANRVGFSDAVKPCRETQHGYYITKSNKDYITPKSPQGGTARGRKEPKKAPDWKPERFEGLWEYYPHKKRGNRQKAINAWDKLKPNDELISIMAHGLKKLLETIWADVGTPHVSTFLNQRRWEDAANVDDGGAQVGTTETISMRKGDYEL